MTGRGLALDTHILRRLKPGSALHEHAQEAASIGAPFGLPTMALHEVTYGAWRSDRRDLQRRVAWYLRLARRGVLAALPVSAAAAEMAGRLRALCPEPPGGKRGQGDQASRLLGWATEIVIVATTWTHGYDLVSEDSDYRHIVSLLPAGTEPLRVVDLESAGLIG